MRTAARETEHTGCGRETGVYKRAIINATLYLQNYKKLSPDL
jgi:hypothetical protein